MSGKGNYHAQHEACLEGDNFYLDNYVLFIYAISLILVINNTIVIAHLSNQVCETQKFKFLLELGRNSPNNNHYAFQTLYTSNATYAPL